MSNVFDETSRHRGRWRPAGWAGALALSVVAAGCATSGEETGDPAASSTVILNPGTGETQTESCEATGAQAAFVPPIITFVVDTSGSMGFEMPEGGTRWEVTRRALEDAVAALPEQAAVGVVYYPAAETEEDFCFAANSELFVPLAKLDGQQRDEVAQSLEQTVPRGGTPTHDAYRYALFELGATELDGNRFIVLTTDGAAQVGLRCVNFYDHESMLADVRSGSEKFGVRTFVIGAPGSEGFEDEEFATPDFRAELSVGD